MRWDNHGHSFIQPDILASMIMAVAVCLTDEAQASGSNHLTAHPLDLSGSWNMIFDDEFNGTALDTTKWGTCFSNFGVNGTDCTHDQSEQEVYTPSGVAVSNGNVVLTATNTPTDGQNYASGMLVTGPSAAGGSGSAPVGSGSNFQGFSFLHGYIEMRVQVPSGPGLWPAFWLLNDDGAYPPEIDIFEILDANPTTDHMHFHPATGPNANSDGGGSGDPITPSGDFNANIDLSQDYHVYGLDWEAGSLTWFLDGKQIGQYNNDNNDISTKAQYIIINLAVGGDYPTGDPKTGTYPASMKIDYVRVWQHCTANCSTTVPVGSPTPPGGAPIPSPTPTPITVTTPVSPPPITPVPVNPTPVTGIGTTGTNNPSPVTPVIPITTAGTGSISTIMQELQQIEQEITLLIQEIQNQSGQGSNLRTDNKGVTNTISAPTPKPSPAPRPIPTLSCTGEFNCR